MHVGEMRTQEAHDLFFIRARRMNFNNQIFDTLQHGFTFHQHGFFCALDVQFQKRDVAGNMLLYKFR